MEPVSFALSAVSLVDVLIKAYKSVSGTVKDVKHAPEDQQRLLVLLDSETETTQHLRELLFAGLDADPPACLFLDLDKSARKSIYLIFWQFGKAVERHVCPLEGTLHLPTDLEVWSGQTMVRLEAATTASSNLPFGSSRAPTADRDGKSLKTSLWWAFREKSRLQKLVSELEIWNQKAARVVELHVLRYQADQILQRSRATQSKPSLLPVAETKHAEKLGLNDALQAQSLALSSPCPSAASDEGPDGTGTRATAKISFKRPWTELKLLGKPNPGRTTQVGTIDGAHVMVEIKSYHGASADAERETSARRLDQLAQVLQRLHRLESNTIPNCLCWVDHTDQEAYLVAFELPRHLEPRPMSLFDSLPAPSVTSGPPLEQRLRVAYQLASSTSHMHSVSWVHRNLRSENIVFYHRRAGKNDATSSSTISVAEDDGTNMPADWLLGGFEFSRPVDSATSMSLDRNLDRNVYRHPQRWGLPTEKFGPVHDIYALGVVLLELGMWRRAASMLRADDRQFPDPYRVRTTLIRRARTHLGFTVGSRYRQVVLGCLQFEGGGTDENDVMGRMLAAQKFEHDVVEELRCLAFPEEAVTEEG